LASPGSTGGIDDINALYATLKNPAGTGDPNNFDGTLCHATFYYTTIYLVDQGKMVTTSAATKPGLDQSGRNRAAWTASQKAGHETANHTVNHLNGGPLMLGPGSNGLNFSVADWKSELSVCNQNLTDPAAGIGAKASDIVGFRTPYLGYNANLYPALQSLGFSYDTTIPNCFDDNEDGTNCSWPYTLDHGSPDQAVLSRKFTNTYTGLYGAIKWSFPTVPNQPGLWEMPPATLIVPDDSQAAQYKFTAGLRNRIMTSSLAYPDIWEPSTGKIAGLDYSLLNDAKIVPDEMRAILEYSLDLHLKGNRAPFVFIAHSFDYAWDPTDTSNTPSKAERDLRWAALKAFILYANAKPEVRIVNVKDILAWVRRVSGK
jgi:hypothetical protein